MSSTRRPRAWAWAMTRFTLSRLTRKGASKSRRTSVSSRSHCRPKGVKETQLQPRATSSSRAAALAGVP
ncbi:MAG: hypothetical protein IPN17_27710 [Deltaproteobacteria bacterium]|nr:hypothetical protein [Deltaproteobacteria bacterium]